MSIILNLLGLLVLVGQSFNMDYCFISGIAADNLFCSGLLEQVVQPIQTKQTIGKSRDNKPGKGSVQADDQRCTYIRDVILKFLDVKQKSSCKREFDELYWDILSLLELLDTSNSPKCLSILANLAQYYLGEAGGELYSCIILRKGRLIERYLKAERGKIKEGMNDCAPSTNSSKERCFTAKEALDNIDDLLPSLSKLSPGQYNCP